MSILAKKTVPSVTERRSAQRRGGLRARQLLMLLSALVFLLFTEAAPVARAHDDPHIRAITIACGPQGVIGTVTVANDSPLAMIVSLNIRLAYQDERSGRWVAISGSAQRVTSGLAAGQTATLPYGPLPVTAVPKNATTIRSESDIEGASSTSIPKCQEEAASPSAPTVAPRQAPTPTPEPRPARYTVQTGDTLSGIAARFATTVDAIVAANGLSDSSFIMAGQELLVPPPTAGPSVAPPAGRASAGTPVPESPLETSASNTALAIPEHQGMNALLLLSGAINLVDSQRIWLLAALGALAVVLALLLARRLYAWLTSRQPQKPQISPGPSVNQGLVPVTEATSTSGGATAVPDGEGAGTNASADALEVEDGLSDELAAIFIESTVRDGSTRTLLEGTEPIATDELLHEAKSLIALLKQRSGSSQRRGE